MRASGPLPVSAVVLAHDRRHAVDLVVRRLRGLGIDDVLVVDSGSSDGTAEMLAETHPWVTVVDPGGNVGASGRNLGVERARHEHVLMLDDDAYPRPGAAEALLETFRLAPKAAVVGGLVRDVEEPPEGSDIAPDPDVVRHEGLGTFDWWLRRGRTDPVGPEGVPAFFFPEGCCMVRRTPFLEAGGFYAPYFFATSEIDLTTRLVARGLEVRYQPGAAFDHMKVRAGRVASSAVLRYRVRNQVWYFHRHFPRALAARRIAAYLLFDLVQAGYEGALRHWWKGVSEAWTLRHTVAADVAPLPRDVLRRAEMDRGRLHLRLLVVQLRRKALPRA
jgi:GT2 family glycosyltransferase